MEYTELGKSGLKVSRVCLGCLGFGKPTARHPWALGEEESERILSRAAKLGVNFLIRR